MKSSQLQAFIKTVNELGRTPRGFDRKNASDQATFKAVFRASKSATIDLWEIYTQRREDLSRKLVSNQETVVSYLLGFHLANIERAKELYHRSDLRHRWKAKLKGKIVRVYDIGCGTAAMSLALDIDAEYFLIDSSGPLLDAANILAKNHQINAKTSKRAIEDLEPKQFTSKDVESDVHIYLLGYVWNELGKNATARRKLMRIITGHIARKEKCLVFVTEPAIEFMSRSAMELRDDLCQAGYLALYPCPHSNPCPMLQRPKDWCYSEGHWSQPELAQWIDDQLDINRSRYASTMFAFASPALELSSDEKPVVVGRPVREEGKERYKGFFDYLICDENTIRKETPKQPKQVISRGNLYEEKKVEEIKQTANTKRPGAKKTKRLS